MKIENLPGNVPHIDPARQPQKHVAEKPQDFSRVLQGRDQQKSGITLPKESSRAMVQDFAEWYFKLGKTYENTKNYDMAISAYEKSNSVKPDINKMQSADEVRHKDFAEEAKKN